MDLSNVNQKEMQCSECAKIRSSIYRLILRSMSNQDSLKIYLKKISQLQEQKVLMLRTQNALDKRLTELTIAFQQLDRRLKEQHIANVRLIMERDYCVVDDEEGLGKNLTFFKGEVENLYQRCERVEKRNHELQEKIRMLQNQQHKIMKELQIDDKSSEVRQPFIIPKENSPLPSLIYEPLLGPINEPVGQSKQLRKA